MFEGLSRRLGIVIDKLKNKGIITKDDLDRTLREIRIILLEADVNYKIVKEFIASVEKDILGKEILKSLKSEHIIVKSINDNLVEILSFGDNDLSFKGNPAIIMLVGLQGTGKTTVCGKMGSRLNKADRKCILVPCDVKRPAAYEQLRITAEKAGVDFLKDMKNDVVKTIENAVEYSKKNNIDTLILDTAGRLHIDEDLMNELVLIEKKFSPCEVLYVGDSLTGQDAVNSAKGFCEKLPITGIILTKLDGDQKGGAALSIVKTTQKPIKFISTGEHINQFDTFKPEKFASRILGMGDIVSLVERTQEMISEEESIKMQKKLQQGTFDFEDFLDQIKKIKNMGPMGEILKMLPGVGSKIKITGMEENQMKKVESIILSMTKQERKNPELLINKNRLRRIAKGSGNNVSDVKGVIKNYRMMKKMMKELKGGLNPFNMRF